MAGAFYGAFGPGAMAAGTHLRNQEKARKVAEEANAWARYNAELIEYNAAVQRWESWKQWALSHPDWQVYIDEYEAGYRDHLEQIDSHNQDFCNWLASEEGQAEIRSILLEEKRITRARQMASDQHQAMTLLSASVVGATFMIILVIMGLSRLFLPGPTITPRPLSSGEHAPSVQP